MFENKMQTYPDRLEFKEGSGCTFSIFGFSFMLVGIFMLSMVLFSEDHIAHHSLFERLVAGLAGLAFVFAGALFTFGKNGIVINHSQGVMREWSGLFFRFVTETFPLNDFDRVTIEQKGPHHFIVVIEGEDEMITLLSSSTYSVARERGETIAAFAQIDCNDEVQKQNTNPKR